MPRLPAIWPMVGILWVLVLLSLASGSAAHADEHGSRVSTAVIAALPMPDPPEEDENEEEGCPLTNFGCMVKKGINGWFIDVVESASKPVFELLGSTVMATPEMDSAEMTRARELWGISRVIANTCFVLLITVAGVLLMSGLTVPGGGLSVQELLPRIVWGFLAANLSLPVIGYGITFANGLSNAFMQSGGERIDPKVVTEFITVTITTGLATQGIFFALISLVVLVLAVCVAFTYVIRLALTMALIAAAPVALMFHVLPVTDGLSRLWWRGISGVLAIQVCQSLVLVTAFQLLFTDNNEMFLSPPGKADLIDLLLAVCLLYVLVRIPGWVARTIWRSTQPRTLTRLVKSLVLYRGIGTAVGGTMRSFRSPPNRGPRPTPPGPTGPGNPPRPPSPPGGRGPRNPAPGPPDHGPRDRPSNPPGPSHTPRPERRPDTVRSEYPDAATPPDRTPRSRRPGTPPARPQPNHVRPVAPRGPRPGAARERPSERPSPPHVRPRVQPRPRPVGPNHQPPRHPRRRGRS